MGYLKLIYAILLTLVPGIELRLGIPLGIAYAREAGILFMLVFFLIILVNILLIFFIFLFLDKAHGFLMNFRAYRKGFFYYLKKMQRRVDKFEKRYEQLGFIALMLFVAIPFPGTGAWSGCIIAWLLGLERKKSIMAIIAGVMIAGVLVLLGTLGFISFLA